MGVCGVIIMIGGIVKTVSGIRELMGNGEDKQATQLYADSDKAIDEANKDGREAQPLYQGFLDDVDKLGLTAVRSKEKETAQKLGDFFAKSSEAFHLAGKKLVEAKQHKHEEKLIPFLDAKIKSYDFYAGSADSNREIVRLVMDEKIPDITALLPKFNAEVARRDEALKNAEKLAAEAAEIVKKQKQH